MNAFITTLVLALSPAYELPSAAWQLVPHVEGEMKTPKVTHEKAVLCIPGLYPHPIRPEKATMPEMHPWFEPNAPLLAALEKEFDVYAFGYAQTVSLDLVADSNGLHSTIRQLKEAGYKEIVLIGHSAGGLIAFQFAERNPQSGVSKVIPVSAPYAGSELADLSLPLPRTQVTYIRSLSPQPRKDVLATMKPFPKEIEICCVMCKVSRLPNDIMVGLDSQWPEEIRKQGIPTTLVNVNHFEAIKAPQGVAIVADLAKSKLVRWDTADVAKAKAIVFGQQADAAAAGSSKRDRPIINKIRELLNRE